MTRPIDKSFACDWSRDLYLALLNFTDVCTDVHVGLAPEPFATALRSSWTLFNRLRREQLGLPITDKEPQ
jgi:hypothetical protein